MTSITDSAAIAYFYSPQAVRDRSQFLFDQALAGKSAYFTCQPNQLDAAVDYVMAVITSAYPDFNIPFHSRWRHFEINGQSRWTDLLAKLPTDPLERARTAFDAVIISVLLDAGAGDRWRYHDPITGELFARSEGLAIASLNLFEQGYFSSNPARPQQVDATGLLTLTPEKLAKGFQVSADNPLVGLAGRTQLLQALGTAIQTQPTYFLGQQERPGALVDWLWARATNAQLSAVTVLTTVLHSLGSIWPGRLTIADVNLGDTWFHPALTELDTLYPYIPFHKLSQWLTYSLLEPMEALGLTITDLDQLTGLPEYRNGGLCLDLGLLQLKDPTLAQRSYPPDDPFIVEWRALTVIWLDHIARQLRDRLNLSTADFPLVKVLQGGTWQAGRQRAAELRQGNPPIAIASDGTVF